VTLPTIERGLQSQLSPYFSQYGVVPRGVWRRGRDSVLVRESCGDCFSEPWETRHTAFHPRAQRLIPLTSKKLGRPLGLQFFATPLLQVTVHEKPVIVGWTYERPNGGRSFGTTLGHFYSNFQRENFRRMIVNAILWSAQLEIDESGARVDLSQADLALPPEPDK
jgi:hypothetical protein